MVALVVAVGGAFAGTWSTADRAGAGPDALSLTGRRWRRAAPLLLLGALAILLGAQVAAFHDPFEPLLPQIRGLLLRTDWGRVFGAQLLLALLLSLPFVRARSRVFGGLAAASCASLAFVGHSWGVAEGRMWTVGAEIVHAVAAAVWLGGLSVLVAAHRRTGAPGAPGFDLARATARFSRTALVAVPLLLVTGAVANWIHGGGPAALLEPGWGRALAVKILLVGGMAAVGLYNWKVTLPRLDRGEDGVAFGRGAPAWEALLGLAVLGATALLVALSPPAGG
jgi:putative copper export protein